MACQSHRCSCFFPTKDHISSTSASPACRIITSTSPGCNVLRSGWFTAMSAGSFFQRVNDSGRTDLQHPCRIADPTAIETHIHDLLFDHRGTSFVEEIQLKPVMGAAGVLALVALLPSFGFAAFDDL